MVMKAEKEFIERYENVIRELRTLLEEGKTWEDYSLEEYKEEIRRFWRINDIWEKALDMKLYSEEKLNKDSEVIQIFAESLLL